MDLDSDLFNIDDIGDILERDGPADGTDDGPKIGTKELRSDVPKESVPSHVENSALNGMSPELNQPNITSGQVHGNPDEESTEEEEILIINSSNLANNSAAHSSADIDRRSPEPLEDYPTVQHPHSTTNTAQSVQSKINLDLSNNGDGVQQSSILSLGEEYKKRKNHRIPKDASPPNLTPANFNWDSVVEIHNDLVQSQMKERLTGNPLTLTKLACRIHGLSLVVKSSNLNPSLLLLKVSILPLPGKRQLVRPLNNAGKIINETDLEGNSTMVVSFGQKSVILSMSEGDLRSRVFKNGACSRLTFELFYNGETNLIGTGEYFLPGVFDVCHGDIMSLRLEIVDTRLVSEGSLVLDIMVGSAAQEQMQSPPKSGFLDITNGVLSKVAIGASVEVELLGIFRVDDKNSNQIHLDRANIELVLTGSGDKFRCPYNCKFSQAGKPVPTKISLSSHCALIDILLIRVVGYGSKDIGALRIPISMWMEGDSKCSKTVSLKLWPLGVDEKTLKEDGWTIVFKLCCTESGVDPQFATLLGSTINELSMSEMRDPTSPPVETTALVHHEENKQEDRGHWSSNTLPSTTCNETKLPPMIKSQNGCLYGTIGGIVKRKNDPKMGVILNHGGSSHDGESYTVEVQLFPDQTKLCASSLRLDNLPVSGKDYEGVLMANLDFRFSIAWALSQVTFIRKFSELFYINEFLFSEASCFLAVFCVSGVFKWFLNKVHCRFKRRRYPHNLGRRPTDF
jgi:hypothetical protein